MTQAQPATIRRVHSAKKCAAQKNQPFAKALRKSVKIPMKPDKTSKADAKPPHS
eukprot:CAMPEP_0176312238 /NCGR_PEP_ID=MMETSP0121_2-20121125/66562_1 /TAXON_ID=160619 /ORGANISM="Kryptoperidinium foliaceum, Strain CCMP 1326" /LENGTH=53 /DNA_ID=CAMNT_0017654307 /DNA_START=312 /DNA_END=470 /DNA_ORIENTATION=-